jgi:hypothetical protein
VILLLVLLWRSIGEVVSSFLAIQQQLFVEQRNENMLSLIGRERAQFPSMAFQ